MSFRKRAWLLMSILVVACGDDAGGAGPEDAGPDSSVGQDASMPDSGADVPGADVPVADVPGADEGALDAGPDEDAGPLEDAGPAESCPGDFAICQDFEEAELGGFPAMWARREGGWGGRSIGVQNDDAHRGSQALKIESGRNGAQWMTYMGDLGDLRSRHFGRMFVRVNQPAPWPREGLVHGDLFEGRGPFRSGTNRVRWGIVKRWLELESRRFQWIYNVQRDGNEFASQTAYEHAWPSDWFCMEWQFDESEQRAVLWLDGEERSELTQSRDGNPEIPVFSDLSVGWANYQESNEDFVVWIDDVVFDDERVGCER